MADEWDEWAVEGYLDPLVDALTRLDLSGRRCIDVGCGTGLAFGVLAARFEEVIGIEIAPGMLSLARERPNGTVIAGDAAALPLPEGSVDVVFVINALTFVDEIKRVLRPGGLMVWIASLGEDTPIYVPPATLGRAFGVEWECVAAHAGWGTWVCVREPMA